MQSLIWMFFCLPPYEQEVWYYRLAGCIQRPINSFDCEKAFLNVDVNKKELLFQKTTLTVHDFISHETLTCDDRNPHEMTSPIKQAINDKNLFLHVAMWKILQITTVSLKVYVHFRILWGKELKL